MGLLNARKRKIAENAKEHMEAGEEISEMAMTQTDSPNISLAQQLNSSVIALAATNSNLYALLIHSWRPTKVVGAARFPLDRVRLELDDDGDLVIVEGRTYLAQVEGDGEEVEFPDIALSPLTGAGKDAKKLVQYASERR